MNSRTDEPISGVVVDVPRYEHLTDPEIVGHVDRRTRVAATALLVVFSLAAVAAAAVVAVSALFVAAILAVVGIIARLVLAVTRAR